MSRPHTLPARRAIAAIAATLLAAVVAIAAPAQASASSLPNLPPPPELPDLSQNVWLDELGRPTQHTQDQVRLLADQPWVPDEASDLMLTALHFFAGTGEPGGPPLPEEAPTFTQFYWPTVSGNCIGDGLDSVGSALAVPGPADIPAPGAAPGQTAFLFTALGTAPAAGEQHMTVRWFNIDTLTYGETPLTDHGINPDGPATVSGVGDTGNGRILALVEGTVTTEDNACSFLPTAAFIEAR